MKNTFLALLVTSALSVSSAFAVPMTSDVTYNGAEADDVFGPISGNDTATLVSGQIGGDPFSLLAKTADIEEGETPVSNEFQGVTFSLEATIGTIGTWQLSWAETGEPGLPLLMDFVFVTKASTNWAGYLFEDISFTSSPTTGNGTYEITFLNNGGQTPNLSHASIYGRVAGTIIDNPAGVPEPGILLMFGTALLGLGLARTRKAKA